MLHRKAWATANAALKPLDPRMVASVLSDNSTAHTTAVQDVEIDLSK